MSDGAHKVKADIEKNLWKIFFRLEKMTFGLVDVGYSLPEGQAVKLIFFAPWNKERWKPWNIRCMRTNMALSQTKRYCCHDYIKKTHEHFADRQIII